MELLWCIDVSIVEFWVRRYRILRCACRLLELHQGVSPTDSEGDQGSMGHRMSFVMGVFTTFAKRKRRDSIRQTWKPQGRCPFLTFCSKRMLAYLIHGKLLQWFISLEPFQLFQCVFYSITRSWNLANLIKDFQLIWADDLNLLQCSRTKLLRRMLLF